MPPRNPDRRTISEDLLAERIGYERELRNWSYEQLARRMTDAGCAMNQSAIYKIEKAKPRRRITVDELLGFAKVFGLMIDKLLLPRDVAEGGTAAQLYQVWSERQREADEAQRIADEARLVFDHYIETHPKISDDQAKARALREARDAESERG